jgi:hypothetical protein
MFTSVSTISNLVSLIYLTAMRASGIANKRSF